MGKFPSPSQAYRLMPQVIKWGRRGEGGVGEISVIINDILILDINI